MFSFIKQVFRGFSLAVLTLTTVPAAVFICIVGGFIFLPLPATLPEPNSTLPSQPTRIYDMNGQEIGVIQKFDKNIPVEKADIPEILKQATIASEDKNFYKHAGVDIRGTFRALVADFRNQKKVQGGSTITQQYVKNAYTNKERTITRKIREAILASQLDRQVDKDEIMYRYLSNVYLGEGCYGVGAAADSYFHKSVRDLNASEAATLVGIIPAPSARSPRTNRSTVEDFRKTVLGLMLQQRYLTQAQYDDAVAHPLWYEKQGKPSGNVTMIYAEVKNNPKYPHFFDYVTRYLSAKYGEEAIRTNGYRVQTTLVPEIQDMADKAVDDTLRGTSAPLDMALASVEPATGFVKAVVGGRDFDKSQVNLALGACPDKTTQNGKDVFVDGYKKSHKVEVEPTCWTQSLATSGGSGRQPGSSWKPFVLAAAYEQGIKPTTVYPAPTAWSIPDCPPARDDCVIHNAEGEGGGAMTLKDATVHSINTIYAPLIRDIGKKTTGKYIDGFIDTAEMAKKLGIGSAFYSRDFHQLSGTYSLGVMEVSPLDMASAYGVFGNRGKRQPETPVVKILDSKGKVVEDNTNREPLNVLNEAVADNVTDALRGVIERGTGADNGNIGRPAAGKTGTAENYSNAWFVGYTPALSTAVWLGYTDGNHRINYKGNTRVYGGTVPTKTWAAFMRNALADIPATDFSQAAPITSPVRDVLSVGPTEPPPLMPQQSRNVPQTPAGDFDKISNSGPYVAAPDSQAPDTSAPSRVGAPVTPAPPTIAPKR